MNGTAAAAKQAAELSLPAAPDCVGWAVMGVVPDANGEEGWTWMQPDFEYGGPPETTGVPWSPCGRTGGPHVWTDAQQLRWWLRDLRRAAAARPGMRMDRIAVVPVRLSGTGEPVYEADAFAGT